MFHIVSGSQIKDTKIQHTLGTDRTIQFQKEPKPETRPYETTLTRRQHNVSEVDDTEVLGRGQKLGTDSQTSKDKNSSEAEMVLNDVDSILAESGDRMELQKQSRWEGVDPVLVLNDEAVIKSIQSFFGIKESFPLEDHLVTRSPDNARRIYYVSKSVKEILELNSKVGGQLKIASLGVKMFVSALNTRCPLPIQDLVGRFSIAYFTQTLRYSVLFQERHRSKDPCPCAYRLSYDGLSLVLPSISERILYASALEFHRLVQYRSISFAHFTDTRFGEQAASLTPGCCVVVLLEGNVYALPEE